MARLACRAVQVQDEEPRQNVLQYELLHCADECFNSRERATKVCARVCPAALDEAVPNVDGGSMRHSAAPTRLGCSPSMHVSLMYILSTIRLLVDGASCSPTHADFACYPYGNSAHGSNEWADCGRSERLSEILSSHPPPPPWSCGTFRTFLTKDCACRWLRLSEKSARSSLVRLEVLKEK